MRARRPIAHKLSSAHSSVVTVPSASTDRIPADGAPCIGAVTLEVPSCMVPARSTTMGSTLVERRDLDLGGRVRQTCTVSRPRPATGSVRCSWTRTFFVEPMASASRSVAGTLSTIVVMSEMTAAMAESGPQFVVSIRHCRLQCLSLMRFSTPLVRVVAQKYVVGICASARSSSGVHRVESLSDVVSPSDCSGRDRA